MSLEPEGISCGPRDLQEIEHPTNSNEVRSLEVRTVELNLILEVNGIDYEL